jgi:erythromycin esterase-like protein
VVAQPAAHVERPYAVGAHVAERHQVAGWRSGSYAHGGEDTASAGRPESCVTARADAGQPR